MIEFQGSFLIFFFFYQKSNDFFKINTELLKGKASKEKRASDKLQKLYLENVENTKKLAPCLAQKIENYWRNSHNP